MPVVVFGWTKAIRWPPAPTRGRSSIKRYPEAPTAGQGLVEIGHPVADMVNTGASFGHELGDGPFGCEGLQQLNLGFAERQGHDGCAVPFLRPVVGFEAKDVAIKRQALVDAFDRETDMGDSGFREHGASAPGRQMNGRCAN